jgi:hypothetical protein
MLQNYEQSGEGLDLNMHDSHLVLDHEFCILGEVGWLEKVTI